MIMLNRRKRLSLSNLRVLDEYEQMMESQVSRY